MESHGHGHGGHEAHGHEAKKGPSGLSQFLNKHQEWLNGGTVKEAATKTTIGTLAMVTVIGAIGVTVPLWITAAFTGSVVLNIMGQKKDAHAAGGHGDAHGGGHH